MIKKLEAEYLYREADNKPAFSVKRFRTGDNDKSFSQHAVDESGKAISAGLPERYTVHNTRPLLDLPDILDKDFILLVEGERTAKMAAAYLPGEDWGVTTWSGGAQAINQTNWFPLEGKTVVCWPDNDDAGRVAMLSITDRYFAKLQIPSFTIIELSKFPYKWDLADDLPDDVSSEEITAIIKDAAKNAKVFETALIVESLRQEDKGFLASELQHMEFPEIKYIVPKYIPEGVSLIAGKPKLGKSWMCLDIAIAVSTGGKAFDWIKCDQGDVLYLALEDNPRRLQSRMKCMLSDQRWPSRLRLKTSWPKLDAGCVKMIQKWIDEQTAARLVIIDTLAKIRVSKKDQDTLYAADYGAIEELQSLAAEKGIAIILVHHVRKAEAEDPLDTVSGTTGLTGAVDTILVLSRTTDSVTLYARGRDIEEIETAIEFNRRDNRWRILGEASEVRRSGERKAIIKVLSEATEPMTPREISDATNMPPNNIKQLLRKMAIAHEVVKVGRAKYTLPDNLSNSITLPSTGSDQFHDNSYRVTEVMGE